MAVGQKMDRGIDMTSQPCFVNKGTWMIGGGASYMLHNNNDLRLLVVNGINSTGYNCCQPGVLLWRLGTTRE